MNQKAQIGLDTSKKVILAVTTMAILGFVMIVALTNMQFADVLQVFSSGDDTILANVNSPQTLSQTPYSGFSATVYNQTWLEFDGVDDKVNLTLSMNNHNETTVCSWIYVKNFTSGGDIIKFGSPWSNYFRLFEANSPVGTLKINFFDNVVDAECNYQRSGYSTNTWHHLCVSYNLTSTTGTCSLFINSIEYIDTLVDGSQFNLSDLIDVPFVIGDNFNGSIDEVFIINEKLKVGQIVTLYYQKLNQSFIPVLNYHGIADGSDGSTNYSQFIEQLDYLNSSGYETITDIEYYNWTQNQGFVMPTKPIMLIFDDGIASILSVAAQNMSVYGYKGVVAITTDLIGSSSNYMNWSNVSTLINDYNWSIASHSSSHCWMADSGSPLNCTDTISRRGNMSESKLDIIVNTGFTPITFIHPYNNWNTTTMSDCLLNYTLCFGWGYNVNEGFRFINKDSNFSNGDLVRLKLGFNTTTLIDYDYGLNRNLSFLNTIKYNFNENSGTTAYDVSGNANNGTITGATWANDGINVTLTEDTDYTLVGAIFTVINSEHSWGEIITNYLVSSTQTTQTRNILNNLTGGVESFFSNAGTWFALLAIVILIMIIVIVMKSVSSIGGQKDGGL